jgi:hypothetical protein
MTVMVSTMMVRLGLAACPCAAHVQQPSQLSGYSGINMILELLMQACVDMSSAG